MGAYAQDYEIRLRIIGRVIEHLSWKGADKHEKKVNTYHVECTNPSQLQSIIEKLKRKYKGEFVSCEKISERVTGIGSIESLKLDQSMYGRGNPFQNAIQMETMNFNKQVKKRANLYKDKND